MRRERHGLPAARTFDAIILPAERHVTVIGGDEPAIGDGDAVGVARQVAQHGPRSAERTLGIDHPVFVAQRRQIGCEGFCIGQGSFSFSGFILTQEGPSFILVMLCIAVWTGVNYS